MCIYYIYRQQNGHGPEIRIARDDGRTDQFTGQVIDLGEAQARLEEAGEEYEVIHESWIDRFFWRKSNGG